MSTWALNPLKSLSGIETKYSKYNPDEKPSQSTKIPIRDWNTITHSEGEEDKPLNPLKSLSGIETVNHQSEAPLTKWSQSTKIPIRDWNTRTTTNNWAGFWLSIH